MLPGVGLTRLSRRRRVHYHGGDVASSAGAGEHHAHHHHHYDAHAHHAAPPTGVAGPALAARIRLEEKLRGAALPSTSPGSRSVASLPPSGHLLPPMFCMHEHDSVGKMTER